MSSSPPLSLVIRTLKYSVIPKLETEIERYSNTSTCFCEEFNECPDFDYEEEGCSGGCQCEANNLIQEIYGEIEQFQNYITDTQKNCQHIWSFYHGTTANNWFPHFYCFKCISVKEA